MSSNQALQKVRRAYDAQKAGHTGTLDPFATGMLPICLGEATKTTTFMLDAGKAYHATARLGEATSTGDLEGEIVESRAVPELSESGINEVLQSFLGKIEQVPPMYSALKHEGKRLYEWAREGVEIERKARPVTIYAIGLLNWNSPLLEFEVHCSKGTYIRTLAEDLAAVMGTCAHLIALRRLWVEPFKDQPMVGLETLDAAGSGAGLDEFLLAVDAGLEDWPEVRLEGLEATAFSNGNPVASALAVEAGVHVLVRGATGVLLGLAECDGAGLLKPRRVMLLDDPEQVGSKGCN